MIFTTRSDYGLRAALEPAARYGEGPLSARRIAADGRLPEPFVRKILQDLSAAGIASPRRGRGGGYELARPPAEITLRESLEAFEELAPVACMIEGFGGGHGEEGCAIDVPPCAIEVPEALCPTRAASQAIDLRLRATLEAMTRDDLVAEVRSRGLGARSSCLRRRGERRRRGGDDGRDLHHRTRHDG